MANLSEAYRPIMWNIQPRGEPGYSALIMYILFGIALVVFGYGAYQRVSAWRRGKSDRERVGDWGKRAWILIKELLFQKRVRDSRFPGLFHSFIYYSFIVFVITTTVVALDYDFGTDFFRGYTYVLLTVGSELGGVLVLVGIGMAWWRRRLKNPDTLDTETRTDMWPLWLLAAIIVTGFVLEGLRIAGTAGTEFEDHWTYLTPVGWGIAGATGWMGTEAVKTAHAVTWWVHLVFAFGWIACIPYTKFSHLLSLPTNVFFSRFKPRGELARSNMDELMTEHENPEDDFDWENGTLGVRRNDDITWKQRLDFDACINCGRCDEVCPSRRIDDPFGPKRFIKGLLDFVNKADAAAAKGKNGDAPAEGEDEAAEAPTVVGTTFDEMFVWYCRLCGGCVQVCPAAIDHVDTFVEVRRDLVMMQASIPVEGGKALKMMEERGNPFAPQSERKEWVESLDVRIVKPGEEVDVLVFIGCCTTFDPTKHRIATDLFKLLEHCGVSFGILGNDERCCGDPARLMGNEMTFQAAAQQQIEALKARKFKTLLTACPHCYNVFKNEYPQALFDAKFEVMHHSEFLQQRIASGQIKPTERRDRKVVFHDPCFLGRYQGQYDAPRAILGALPGLNCSEMAENRERSFCCGAGGGHFWMDLHAKERINNLRVAQAKAEGADTIATACSYCKQMLDDALKMKDLEEEIKTVDLASLVYESLPQSAKAPKAEEE
jgi:Fe-S oxidoreductase/nitrate reductase gamma subunit